MFQKQIQTAKYITLLPLVTRMSSYCVFLDAGFHREFFSGGGNVGDPGYKKILPSQARSLGGAISPPVGSRGKAPGSEKQYNANASV